MNRQRPEHPRPQFERKDWVNLNGEWNYPFDFSGSGLEKGLEKSQGFTNRIIVPFAPESKVSGVEFKEIFGKAPAAPTGRAEK